MQKANSEREYLSLLDRIMREGSDRSNRTGMDTRAIFQQQLRFNLADGFPLFTTKKMAFKSILAELLWFLSGSNDVRELNELGSKIWDANAYADSWIPKAAFPGDAGRIYGVQWRSWRGPDGAVIDQLGNVIERIKRKEDNRRLIVTAWNPGELDEMCLPPCHLLFQFHIAGDELSLGMYMRSCDMFLGVPFNVASYGLLLSMVAQIAGLRPAELVMNLADAHIYHNHFDQVIEQLKRGGTPATHFGVELLCCLDRRLQDEGFRIGRIRSPSSDQGRHGRLGAPLGAFSFDMHPAVMIFHLVGGSKIMFFGMHSRRDSPKGITDSDASSENSTCIFPTVEGIADGKTVHWVVANEDDVAPAREKEAQYAIASPLLKLMIRNAYTTEGISSDEQRVAAHLIATEPETDKDCWVCDTAPKGKAIGDTGMCRSHNSYALQTRH